MAEKIHVKLRKKFSLLMQKLLKGLFLKKAENSAIDLNTIQKILVVRINYRIGNILFTTPLLNALGEQFPDAKIDMMIGAPFIAPLIEGMPKINKVYSFDRKLLKKPLEVLALRKEMNANQYDVIIFSSGMSSSDAIMSWMIQGRYKIGFYDKDSFKQLTHTVVALPQFKHEALVPLSIMQHLGVKDVSRFNHYLDIGLSEIEKNNANESIFSNSIGIFRDARGEKKIDDEWWKRLLEALKKYQPSLVFIDILDPNNTEPLYKDMPTVSEKNLRVLAAKISNLKAFICADTGPMHLASASQTATIALFKTTAPTLYGTLGKKDLSLVIRHRSVEEVADDIIRHIETDKGEV